MNYVVGLIFDNYTDDVLYLEKLKPEWQAGKLNGIGGKIEPNETPLEAMVREYQEEVVTPTGIDLELLKCHDGQIWDMFLEWDYGQGIVYFFRAYTNKSLNILENMKNDVGEEFMIRNMFKTYDGFINNLLWIVPCAMFKKSNEIIKVSEIST